jgi:hypothetical protein
VSRAIVQNDKLTKVFGLKKKQTLEFNIPVGLPA